ncbi:hypothetical protein DYB32_002685 [Aphanomyces invadans]|uniref:Chloride channel protein n=1 Tax=Aphanomyces invadans TaxID=157072 RepID=A0A3R6Z7H0_9STRA|nr:hypothetical protein DYB32_002685 [Aphanomyces invadans]
MNYASKRYSLSISHQVVMESSGVSQMKVVLTGVDPNLYLPGYFSLMTLVAKLGGLILCNGAGLVVGTEGAWTHLMSILTHQLLRLPIFASLQTKPSTRLQLLAAASAVAVSSTFASPLGGVLFSIEVTATYYLISNYMKAFLGAVGAAIVVQVTTTIVQDDGAASAYPTDFPHSLVHIVNLPLALPLGVLLGLLSSLLIRLVRLLSDKRTAWRNSSSPLVRVFVTWVDPFCVVVLTSVVTFSPSAYVSPADLPRYYFSTTNATATPVSRALMDGLLPLALLPLAITLAVPSGVGLPTFAMGAALGRLYGDLLVHMFPDLHVLPQAYALMGAACMTGGSTRTVSTAVIALETTASLAFMLPVFAATLVAIETSKAVVTESIYDATVNDLPYMPCLDFYADTTADDIKETQVVYVTRKPSILSILVALNRMPGHEIPVVESEGNRMLLGRISSRALCRVVARYYAAADLGDYRADCGLDVAPAADAAVGDIATATDNSTWVSIKSAVTSLNRATTSDFTKNSVDRLYYREPGSPSDALERGNGGLRAANIVALLSQTWSVEKCELLRHGTTKLPASAVQALPISVSSNTLLEDIHMIFQMLRLDHCFVTHHGALVGVVTTNAVISASRGDRKRSRRSW